MKGILDVEYWRDSLVASFSNLGAGVVAFLPRIVAAALVIVIGWTFAKLVAGALAWILRRSRVDDAAARLRVTETMTQAGIHTAPSQIVGAVVFWVLMLTFLRIGVDSLGLTVLTRAIDGLVGYLPSLAAAGLILLLGLFLGRITRNLISSGAATIGLPQATRLGEAARGLVVVVSVVMALERLGIDTGILVSTLTALVAAAGITMGVSFALGARPLVTHILAGHYLRGNLPVDREVEIAGRKGVVDRIGAVDTVFRDEQRSWSIPNGRILEEIVTR